MARSRNRALRTLTARAALVLPGMLAASALAMPVATAHADVPAGLNSLSIAIDGLRNTRGTVLMCITANAAAFPDCSGDPLATRLRMPAASVTGDMRVAIHGAGTYAVAVIHDENGNGRLDTMMMMPREGFGFSRNPRIRMGPPRFNDASFPVNDTPVRQALRVRYML